MKINSINHLRSTWCVYFSCVFPVLSHAGFLTWHLAKFFSKQASAILKHLRALNRAAILQYY